MLTLKSMIKGDDLAPTRMLTLKSMIKWNDLAPRIVLR